MLNNLIKVHGVRIVKCENWSYDDWQWRWLFLWVYRHFGIILGLNWYGGLNNHWVWRILIILFFGKPRLPEMRPVITMYDKYIIPDTAHRRHLCEIQTLQCCPTVSNPQNLWRKFCTKLPLLMGGTGSSHLIYLQSIHNWWRLEMTEVLIMRFSSASCS
jgi:hypothetical protein